MRINIEQDNQELNANQRAFFEQGIRYALSNLSEVYGEGLELTDLWNEYMNKEPKLVAFDKWLENKENN